MPKYSVMPKCLSYPGTGQRNFTRSSLHQGVLPMMPCVYALETVSYMTFSEELPYTMMLAGSFSIICPISSLASSMPSSTP